MDFVERSRSDVCKRKPDRRIVHSEISKQREIPANDVIRSFDERVPTSLGVERARALFPEMPDGESNHPTSAGCACEDGRFHQPLEINRRVVAHLAQAPGDVDPRGYGRAFKDAGSADVAQTISH